MSQGFLETGIEYLKGVGPQKASLLKEELAIKTFGDLLRYYPFRYVDRTRVHTLLEILEEEGEVQLELRLSRVEEIGGPKAKRLVAMATDGQRSIELVWFKGIKWIKSSLVIGGRYVIFGKPSRFKGKINIVHPEMEMLVPEQEFKGKGMQPVYHTTEKLSNRGLNSSGIARLTAELVRNPHFQLQEYLPTTWLQQYNWPEAQEAFQNVHHPSYGSILEKAIQRIKFEEFFFLELHLLRHKLNHKKTYKGFVFSKVGDAFNDFYFKQLPFELTDAQKRVMKEIRADMGSGEHMNRLLQGDVGSGKTIVALLCMLLALDNGFQASLMAPTEILATQHYHTLTELLDGLPYPIRLLTGSTKTAQRNEIHSLLESGELPFLVGTHALLEEKVKFKNLGLAIIDEQHRFGVAQRATLWKKNTLPPHILVMTATPIPRTLAMTVHGDLDVSVIDELPPGRKPIKTVHRFESRRLEVIGFMKQEIAKGRQVYVVFPLIEESETLDYKNLQEGFQHIQDLFPRPEFEVAMVHGQMKPEEKDFEMKRFAEGVCQILVATTVIEVGVNVPNATVMLVESAERFGLSQLHQLRGRVGRGGDQSYCILMTGQKLSNEARTRMETMVTTQDGFRIAEVDLQLRGPGDLLGTQQSGLMDLKLASLTRDAPLLHIARDKAEEILRSDEEFEQLEAMKIEYRRRYGKKAIWFRIS